MLAKLQLSFNSKTFIGTSTLTDLKLNHPKTVTFLDFRN